MSEELGKVWTKVRVVLSHCRGWFQLYWGHSKLGCLCHEQNQQEGRRRLGHLESRSEIGPGGVRVEV